VKNDFLFLSLSQTGGKAQFRLRLPFDGSQSGYEAAIRETAISQIRAAAEQGPQPSSHSAPSMMASQSTSAAPFETLEDLQPKEGDYVYRNFRAISASPINCYGLDFSKPGVLQASTPLLAKQTVYKDHIFWSVDRWVGVISKSLWDAKGEQSEGVPGINVELKLDWRKDPWLARGLMMEPPAVHSFSVTVFFEFDFSHPDLVEEGRFWGMLGKEVDGEIVRLIVTKILGYWEGSLVFQGADEFAKQLPDDGTAEENMNAGGGNQNLQTQRSQTVKLSPEMRVMLGLPDTVGEDVPDAELLPALSKLGVRAQAGDTLLETARVECRRAATLATLGSEEGTLPDALSSVINKADATELSQLTQMYNQQAAERFPTGGRSSVEDATTVHQAGGVQPPAQRPAKQVPIY
jgi:hypothetical protein